MGGSVVAEAHCAVVPVVVAVRNLWPVHAAAGVREMVPNGLSVEGRRRQRGGAERAVRLGPHLQVKRTAGDNLLMGEPCAVDRLAVEPCRLDVDVLGRVAVGADREGAARVEVGVEADRHLFEYRRGEQVDVVARADGVDARCGQYVPGAHLADVFVAAQPQHVGSVGAVADAAGPFLRKPCLARIREEERYVVDRFVGVVVVVVPEEVLGRTVEKVGQLPHERVVAQQVDQTIDVVRHEPPLLERVRLGAVLILHRFAAPRTEAAVAFASAEPADRVVPDVPVVERVGAVAAGVEAVAQFAGQCRHAPVAVGIFERAGDVHRGVTQPAVVAGVFDRVAAEAVALVDVPVADPLAVGVREHRYGRVAQHAARVGVHDLPTGEVAAAADVGQADERVDLVVDHAGVDERLQRELAPEDVPAAEDRPVDVVGVAVDLSVAADILAVGVGHVARVDHRVVEGGVEDGLVAVGPGDFHPAEGVAPRRTVGFVDGVEVPVGNVVFQVAAGPFGAHERDAGLEQHLFAGAGRKLAEETDVAADGTFVAPFHGCMGYGVAVGAVAEGLEPHLFHGQGGAPGAALGDRPTELAVEVDGVVDVSVAVAPSAVAGRAADPPLNGGVVHHADELFGGRTADAAGQVEADARGVALGEGHPDHPGAAGRGQFDADVIVVERHGIVTGAGLLRVVRVGRAVAAAWHLFVADVGVERSDAGGHQQVAEVAVPADAAHVDEAETFDGGVVPRIAGAVVAAGAGVGAELHQSERGGRAGECFAQTVAAPAGFGRGRGSDHRVDVIDDVALGPDRCLEGVLSLGMVRKGGGVS